MDCQLVVYGDSNQALAHFKTQTILFYLSEIISCILKK